MAARLRTAGATDVQIRRFLTFTCAMDRARDANRLWQDSADLFLTEPWAFEPEDVLRRQGELATALKDSGVSQRHGPDTEAWITLARSLSAPDLSPAIWRAIVSGHGDAAELLRERLAVGVGGAPMWPMIRGPKVGPMWVRMLAFPGGATLSCLTAIPVAVDIHVRRATERLGVAATQGLDLEKARPIIQTAWTNDVAQHGAAGPRSLEGTCAALDPALWFFGKYGCSRCAGRGEWEPIADVCEECTAWQ